MRRGSPIVDHDDLGALLPRCQISLKARCRRPGPISSYLTLASRFNVFLVAKGAPTKVSAITVSMSSTNSINCLTALRRQR